MGHECLILLKIFTLLYLSKEVRKHKDTNDFRDAYCGERVQSSKLIARFTAHIDFTICVVSAMTLVITVIFSTELRTPSLFVHLCKIRATSAHTERKNVLTTKEGTDALPVPCAPRMRGTHACMRGTHIDNVLTMKEDTDALPVLFAPPPPGVG